MNTQPHYGMHHPSVYINPSDARSGGGAASPVGLLNFAHWQTGAAEVDAAAAAGAKDGRRGGVREDIDWDEGSSARRHQHQQQSTPRQRDDRQVSHLRLQEKTRPHTKDAVGAGEQCGPPPPQPPPPPPPPVLSAAQQRHLKQIQHHDRLALEHRRANAEHGGRGREVLPQQHGGGGVPYGGEEQVGARRPTVQHAERHQQQPPQHRSSGQPQQAVLPLPRYTNSMPPGGPHCPSPIVQVPIYKTLEEALHEQQKQQKLQQQQQQSQHRYPPNLVHPHQAGAIAFPAPSPRMVHGPSQAPTIVPGNKAGYESFTTADRLSSPRIVHPHHQQHQQQQQHEHQRQQQQQQHERQQQQQQEHRGRQVHVTVSEGLTHSQQQHLAAQQQARHRSVNISGRELASPGRGFSGGVDGRASPRGVGNVSQNRPFRGPVPAPPPPPPPLQPVPVQAQRPTTPGSRAGLHVQLSENVNGPGAPSPAIVYAYPSRGGYNNMMKLPPGLVQTPRSTRSQVSQRWDPYECVSPAGDNGHNGFRSNYRNKQGAAAVSLEGSPATSSMTGESTGDTATICSESTSTADIDDNSTFIKPLSSLTDVIERGFHGEETPQGRTDVPKPEVMPLHDNNAQESVYETPRRVQRVSFPDSGVKCGVDKENARSMIGVVGGGKKLGGNTGGIYSEQETLSGSKRGGDEIAKQKSFTGSYFQVSPSSFLKPNKRQRNLV